MVRLSPKQIKQLATCICGGADTPFEYRRAVDIESFIKFSGVGGDPGRYLGSRFTSVCAFLEDVNSSAREGESGLPLDVELVILAAADRREYETDADQENGIDRLQSIVATARVKLTLGNDLSVSLQSAFQSPQQKLLDAQIHTAFGTRLKESDLHAARVHYANAKRLLDGSPPDFANSCKESVCSIESVATALTGARDLPEAIQKAVNAKLVPPAIGQAVIKVFAYRGAAPGIAHGTAQPPDVARLEAELLFNLAGSFGKYLGEKLRRQSPSRRT